MNKSLSFCKAAFIHPYQDNKAHSIGRFRDVNGIKSVQGLADVRLTADSLPVVV